MHDLIITGRIISGESWFDGAIAIDGGKITWVRREKPPKNIAGEYHDYGSRYIMPGIVDTHVHFRDPGLTEKEDFGTGSISAAFGGVTTVLDMPNTIPPVIDTVSLVDKNNISSRSSVIDYGLYMGIIDESSPRTIDKELSGSGKAPPPSAYKCFLGESTGKLILRDINNIQKSLHYADIVKRKMSVHAEDGGILERYKDRESTGGLLEGHLKRRPWQAETVAISRLKDVSGRYARSIHLLHISSSSGINAARGTRCTIEVTPHHLFFDMENTRNLETPSFAKVNPPIRTRSDRAALWEGISRGDVQTIGSDHAPHKIEEKSDGVNPPSGMPGVETMLPLLLNEVSKKNITIFRLTNLLSSNPTKIFGIKNKGMIKEGYDADLVVFDISKKRRIRSEDLHSKCGWSTYEGMYGIFPEAVYSIGEKIIEGDNLLCGAGRGANVCAHPP